MDASQASVSREPLPVTLPRESEPDEPDICPHCGNGYQVKHLVESKTWSDFGFRCCLFCGCLKDILDPAGVPA